MKKSVLLKLSEELHLTVKSKACLVKGRSLSEYYEEVIKKGLDENVVPESLIASNARKTEGRA